MGLCVWRDSRSAGCLVQQLLVAYGRATPKRANHKVKKRSTTDSTGRSAVKSTTKSITIKLLDLTF